MSTPTTLAALITNWRTNHDIPTSTSCEVPGRECRCGANYPCDVAVLIAAYDHAPLATATSTGIALDADSVRAEIEERPLRTWDTPEQATATAAYVDTLTDDDLNTLINNTADDAFWTAYDHTRSTVIAHLTTNVGA